MRTPRERDSASQPMSMGQLGEEEEWWEEEEHAREMMPCPIFRRLKPTLRRRQGRGSVTSKTREGDEQSERVAQSYVLQHAAEYRGGPNRGGPNA